MSKSTSILIPKIIHYCWFGTKPIPDDYQGYIDGWKRLMPDYEIRLWNEANSPMHLPYLQAALKYKKWANLANFVRIYALYHHGGIYMDTDMEVLKSLEPFRQYGSFLGLELGEKDDKAIVVNNAIFGAEKRHPFVEKCMDFYLQHFDGRDSALDSSPYLVTRLLKEAGMHQYGRQNVGGVELFPKEYFYPYHITEKFSLDCVKDDTHTIHHWGYSWGKRPFSYRLEHLKKVAKEKVYRALPVHQKGYLKHGKMVADLLKNGTVKAGPFEGIQLAVDQDYEAQQMPLQLSGLYQEELQAILYRLTNRSYQYIYYNGKQSDFFGKGLAKLFPKATVNARERLEDKPLNLNEIAANALLITNSSLAKKLVAAPEEIPSGTDVVLAFDFHWPEAQKERLAETVEFQFKMTSVPSQLNYQYEQNAFLQNYSLKEIEQHLKRDVRDVSEWIVLERKVYE
ncbi:MAG: glycosyltransferase [Bacteroidota bacterium]